MSSAVQEPVPPADWEQFRTHARHIMQAVAEGHGGSGGAADAQDPPNVKDSLHLSPDEIASLLTRVSAAIIAETGGQQRRIVPREHQVAAAVAFFHGYRVLQVRTGEGKSVVTLLIVGVLVLCGERVHVGTSNDLLSERDCKFMQGTLERLGSPMVNTTTAHLKDSGDDVNLLLTAKPGTVLFGTMHQLLAFSLYGSAEVLQELASGAASVAGSSADTAAAGRGYGRPKRKWCLLIDEIDFLICNAMLSVTQLSVTTFGTEELLCLSPVFVTLMASLRQQQQQQQQQRLEGDGLADVSYHAVRRALVQAAMAQIDHAEHKYKTLSPRQASLLRYTLATRIDSVIAVTRSMDENVDFVINTNKGIVAVSQETGLLEENVVFGLGKDQILAVSSRQFVYGEGVVSRTLSAASQFAALYKSIGGWSGSLGSEDTCNFITHVIGRTTQADPPKWLCVPPSLSSNRRTMLEPRLTDSQQEHFDAIFAMLESAMAAEPGSGDSVGGGPRCGAALVIFDSIAAAEQFHADKFPEGAAATPLSVLLVTRNGAHSVPTEELPLGAVVITTMMMHRGEDLRLSPAVVAAGGLLEVDTFVGQSDRTDIQKWGRVARNGDPGTVARIIDRSACPFAGGVSQTYDSIIELRNFSEALEQVSNDGANMANLARVDKWNLEAQIAIKRDVALPLLQQEALDLWGFQMDLFRSFEPRLRYEQLMNDDFDHALKEFGLSVNLPVNYPSHAIALAALLDRLCRFPHNTIFSTLTQARVRRHLPPSVDVDEQFLYQCSCIIGRPIAVLSYSDPHQRKDRQQLDDLGADDEERTAQSSGLNMKLYYCHHSRVDNIATGLQSYVDEMAQLRGKKDQGDGDAAGVASGEGGRATLPLDLHPIYLFRFRSGEEMFRNGEAQALHEFLPAAGSDESDGEAKGQYNASRHGALLPFMSCVFSLLYGSAHSCGYSCNSVPVHVPPCYGSVAPGSRASEDRLCGMIEARMLRTSRRCGEFCLCRGAAPPQLGSLSSTLGREHLSELGRRLSAWNDKTSFVPYFSSCVDHFIASLPTAGGGGGGRGGGGTEAGGTVAASDSPRAFLAPSPSCLLRHSDASACAESKSKLNESFDEHYKRAERQFPCHRAHLLLVRVRHLARLKDPSKNHEVAQCLKEFIPLAPLIKSKWEYLRLITQLPLSFPTAAGGAECGGEGGATDPLEQQLVWIDFLCDKLRVDAEADLDEIASRVNSKAHCTSLAPKPKDILAGVVPNDQRSTVGTELDDRVSGYSTRVTTASSRSWCSTIAYLCTAAVRIAVGMALYSTAVGVYATGYLFMTAIRDLHSAWEGTAFVPLDYIRSEFLGIAESGLRAAGKAICNYTGYSKYINDPDTAAAALEEWKNEAKSMCKTLTDIAGSVASSCTEGASASPAIQAVQQLIGSKGNKNEGEGSGGHNGDNLQQRLVQVLGQVREPGMEPYREALVKVCLSERRMDRFKERLAESLPAAVVSQVDAFVARAAGAPRIPTGCGGGRAEVVAGGSDATAPDARDGSGCDPGRATATVGNDDIANNNGSTNNDNSNTNASDASRRRAAPSLLDSCAESLKNALLAALDSEEAPELVQQGWMAPTSHDGKGGGATEGTDIYVRNTLKRGLKQELKLNRRESDAMAGQVQQVHQLLVTNGYLHPGLARSGDKVPPGTDISALKDDLANLIAPAFAGEPPQSKRLEGVVDNTVKLLEQLQTADSTSALVELLQPLQSRIETELEAYAEPHVARALEAQVQERLIRAAMERGRAIKSKIAKAGETMLAAARRAVATAAAPSSRAVASVQMRRVDGILSMYSDGPLPQRPAAAKEVARALQAGDLATVSDLIHPLKVGRPPASGGGGEDWRQADLDILFHQLPHPAAATEAAGTAPLSMAAGCPQERFAQSVRWARSFLDGNRAAAAGRCFAPLSAQLRVAAPRRRSGALDDDGTDTRDDDEARADFLADMAVAAQADAVRGSDLRRVEEVYCAQHPELPVAGSTPESGRDNGAAATHDGERAFVSLHAGRYVRSADLLQYSVVVLDGTDVFIQCFSMGSKSAASCFRYRALTTYANDRVRSAAKEEMQKIASAAAAAEEKTSYSMLPTLAVVRHDRENATVMCRGYVTATGACDSTQGFCSQNAET